MAQVKTLAVILVAHSCSDLRCGVWPAAEESLLLLRV